MGKDNIIYYGCYCDDGFIIFYGFEIEIYELFVIVNFYYFFFKFMCEFFILKINFFDIIVFKGNKILIEFNF